MSDKEINNELNTISNLNGIGVIGLIVPIVGFICYGITRGRARKMLLFMNEQQKEKYTVEITRRIVLANTMIFFCIVSALLIFYVWASKGY